MVLPLGHLTTKENTMHKTLFYITLLLASTAHADQPCQDNSSDLIGSYGSLSGGLISDRSINEIIIGNSGSTIVTDRITAPDPLGQYLGDPDAHYHRTITRIQPDGMPLPLPPLFQPNLFGVPILPKR